MFVPVNKTDMKNGNLDISITKDEGSNAICSEIFVIEKSATDNKKKILIISGDEYHN